MSPTYCPACDILDLLCTHCEGCGTCCACEWKRPKAKANVESYSNLMQAAMQVYHDTYRVYTNATTTVWEPVIPVELELPF